MVVEHFIGNTDSPTGFHGFSMAALGQHAPAFALVAGIAVGDGNELHVVAHPSKKGGGTSRAAVAIVRVSAERNDAELAVRVASR